MTLTTLFPGNDSNMPLNFSPCVKQTKSVPVEVGGDTFTVEVRRQTGREVLQAMDTPRDEQTAHLLKTTVCGWSGVERDGKPLPFSVENLMALGDAVPQAMWAIADAVYAALKEMTPEKKVSEPQLVESSKAASDAGNQSPQ